MRQQNLSKNVTGSSKHCTKYCKNMMYIKTETESKGEGHCNIRDILKAACQISKTLLPANQNIWKDQKKNV